MRNALSLARALILRVWHQCVIAPAGHIRFATAEGSIKGKRALFHAVQALLHRIWIFESVSSAVLIGVFFVLWTRIQAGSAPISELATRSAAIIPVLAITNAISLLGANTYLARYSAFDKINDLFSVASRLVGDNLVRWQAHPRDSKFARQSYYIWLGKRASIKSIQLSEPGEVFFTPRPYWDGVWFYGSNTYNAKRTSNIGIFLRFHELVICSIFLLRFVLRLRNEKATTQLTQGSIWFLKELKKYESLLRGPFGNLTYQQAIGLVLMAQRSFHYMSDEFRSHQEELSWEEYRKLRFIGIFADYLVWLNYFEAKFLLLRFASISAWLEGRGRSVSNNALSERFKIYGEVKAKLLELRETIIPRKAIAEKVVQVRIGSLIPIILTALTLFTYAVLQPMTLGTGDPLYARYVAAAVYSLACAAIAENFLFGLWLLIPWKPSSGEQLVPWRA
jgi:hypothetical protein